MSVDGFSVRRATERDAGPLSECRMAMFKELGDALVEADKAKFLAECERAIAAGIQQGYSLSWLAEDETGRCVSSLVMQVFQRLPSPKIRGTIEGYILNVYVRLEARRQGVASALMRAAVDHARGAGFARIRLHATEEGRGVYAALGFKGRLDEMELLLGEDG